MTALLDVNVLLAMFWPSHVFFNRATRWFGANRSAGWATCPLTEAGFVRLYTQPAVTGIEITPQDAMEILAENCAQPDHVFWPQDYPVFELRPEIRSRLVGHQQVTDAILLDLAMRKGGRLVTFDQHLENLVPAGASRRQVVEVIPEP